MDNMTSLGFLHCLSLLYFYHHNYLGTITACLHYHEWCCLRGRFA
jgi:hypothetical protein